MSPGLHRTLAITVLLLAADPAAAVCVGAFMNCGGDDDVDAKRSRPSIGKTREVPREERARAFGRDPISESHQGQRP
jgi:hypothetical protein